MWVYWATIEPDDIKIIKMIESTVFNITSCAVQQYRDNDRLTWSSNRKELYNFKIAKQFLTT